MLRAAFLSCALLPARFASATPGQLVLAAKNLVSENAQISFGYNVSYQSVCHDIAHSTSPTWQVFFPGSPEFKLDIAHSLNSSSQISVCSVRPGTAEDICSILREIGSTRTPFAIKCSGHNANPGFSSTSGVQISMTRFRDIVLDVEEETVEIGGGLTWTDGTCCWC